MEFNFGSAPTTNGENVYHGAEGVFANQAAAQQSAQGVPLGGGIPLTGSTTGGIGIGGTVTTR